MQIRPYRKDEVEQLVRLHYETVHTENTKDYNQEHIEAWPSSKIDERVLRWKKALQEGICLVAEEEEKIAGFGLLTKDGELKLLYVHPNFIRSQKRVGSSILRKLEEVALEMGIAEINLGSTITALEFYLKLGYINRGPTAYEMNGVLIPAIKMRKTLISSIA